VGVADYRVVVNDGDDLDRRYAWAIAEQMRLHRAWLVGEVASGAMTLEGLLTEQAKSPWCATVKVVVLAERAPGVGKVRARRAMEELGISEDARWGELDQARLRALWAAMVSRPCCPSEAVASVSRVVS
jgi:hypothetical protein